MFALVLPFWVRGVRSLRAKLNAKTAPLVALFAAFSFVIMVLATHDLQLTREVADRICLLNEAHQVELVGRPSEILEQTELLRSANLL